MQQTSIKFGPSELAPGVTRKNAWGVMISALCTIPAITFVSFMQPYLFEEVYHIPKSEWGSLTGNLAAMQEIITILLMTVIGSMSDNFGRRPIMLTGLVLLAAGYVLYPLAAGQTQIALFRMVVALGAVCIGGMHSVLMADTPANNSRGKWIGLGSMVTGLGMVSLAMGAGRLPKLFQNAGVAPDLAGQYAFWAIAGVCLIIALLLRWTLYGGRISNANRRPLKQLMREGFKEARGNPKIALSYACAFASRGDLLVVGSYLSLWVVQAGAEQGHSTADSMIRYGMLFGMVQGTAMLWGFLMGVICDRVNRLVAICFAFALAAIAYLTMGNMTDPFHSSIIVACVLLGAGEISTVVAGGTLIGQEAPVKTRGSVVGVFGFFGAGGLLMASFVGGQVFDAFSPTAPFTMMGIVNSIVCLFAVWVYWKHRAPAVGVETEVA